MELNTFKDAFDRVTKKQKLSGCKSQEVLEQLSREMKITLSKLEADDGPSSDWGIILNELKIKLNEIAPLSQLEGAQKELNVAVSREGLFAVGDCFVNEVGGENIDAMRAPFVEMYHVLDKMKNKNVDPALSWAGNNREKLLQNGSDLELKLRRIQFLEILQDKDKQKEALKYARDFLSPFATTHITEVQKLLACLLWAGNLEKSPYSELMSATNWEELAEDFTRQYCNVLGQSCKSPLGVTISAGLQGLPTLLKMMNVMIGRKQEWQNMKQLPVPMDLDKEFQFHSVFVCPVSRDQASEENPPMLLTCGHVLCKQSIMKLSKNNSTRPFKCPYCPSEVEGGKCRQLYL